MRYLARVLAMGLSVSGYAAHRRERGYSGQTEKAIRKAIRAGRIAVESDGMIDPAKADRAWAQNTGVARGGRRGGAIATRAEQVGASGQTYADVQLAHEKVKLRQRKLILRRAKGRSCDVAEVTEFVSGLLQEAQEAILAIPAAHAAEGGDELGCDAAALEVWLERVLREEMADLTAEKLERAERFKREKVAADG